MGSRTQSREHALQALYYMDMRQNVSKETIDLYCSNFNPSEKLMPFFLDLVNGVLAHQQEIDHKIEQFSQHWKLSRMSCVDRNIIRMASFELLYKEDIPPKVSINEAINLGKKFGTDESGAFINGILDTVHIAMDKGELEITEKGKKDE